MQAAKRELEQRRAAERFGATMGMEMRRTVRLMAASGIARMSRLRLIFWSQVVISSSSADFML
jgi:hypothetical protein